jgi:hypothetical protein
MYRQSGFIIDFDTHEEKFLILEKVIIQDMYVNAHCAVAVASGSEGGRDQAGDKVRVS